MRNFVYLKIIFILLLFVNNTNCNANGNYTFQKDTIVPKKQLNNSNSEINKNHLLSNIAPEIHTTSILTPYCPGSFAEIVDDVTIIDPDDTSTNAVYIQISTGYTANDKLKLNNEISHLPITASWDATAGKLKLFNITGAPVSYIDFIKAIKDVQFNNPSPVLSGSREFSVTIGQANYLPFTGHYYQFIPSLDIKWTEALTDAAASNYFGLKGYLSTITSLEESDFVRDKLADATNSGAGWIGGTDESTPNIWKWVTGPEAGTIFWNGGPAANNTSPTFAFWNSNEPNNPDSEFYAHIVAPGTPNSTPGSWNNLSNSGSSGYYQPKGYIVEYGGMPGDPTLHISDYTSLTIAKIASTTPGSRCGSGSLTLSATTSAGTPRWYDSANNGTLLYTGSPFTPNLASTTTFYVDAGCPGTRTPVTATVNPLPTANPVLIPRQCDDNQDGKITFNTTTIESTILGNQTNLTVTYFDQNNNQLKDSNGILYTSFPISFSTTSQTIRAVVTDNSSLHCSNETNIQFIVDDLPEAFAVPASLTTACDDEPNPLKQDGKFTFDTSSFEAIILKGQTGMTVNYTLENGTVLSTLGPAFLTGTQNVLVKVTNPVNTKCTATTTLNFVVNSLPIVKNITIVQCDSDLISDGKTLFNLTVNNNVISTNYGNENFSYFTSLAGANSGILTDLISNDLDFENTTPSTMDIWARVANKITGCFSVAKLTLIVPATNLLPSYKIIVPPVCDDYLDVVNNNRDGIATFDFSWTKGTILAQLANQNYTINYYKTKANALSELDPIINISNYRNIGYRDSQDIWVRIESGLDNTCVGLGPFITLKVEALPFANSVIIPSKCDENQDGIVTFDTSNLEKTLLGTNQTYPINVAYFDAADKPLKDINGFLITGQFPNNFVTKAQIIKAVVTNKTDLKCYDETKIQFLVDVLPQAFPIPPALTTACDDELDPLSQDGRIAFDTSTFEGTILGGQNGMKVTYTLQNGTTLSTLSPTFTTGTQNILATVINPLNTSCTATTNLNFIVHSVPNINMNTNGAEDVWVCDNLPNYYVTLTAGIQAGLAPSDYDYIWKKDGNPNPVGTNSSTLDVNLKGVYTVEVKNKSFGCSRTRTITVRASNSATIDTIEIIDLTDVNSVTVIVTGPGNYEYSLDEPTGPWQDSNIFDNVSAGIHDVYINDKNGCGVVPKTIAVIGAPKFFTPNNDGYNDYWSVKGVNETFNSKSIIYIFDRYGKLIKQWIPTINKGWDGTVNGIPLPADDYWFTLKLEDGREAKGHFSLKR